MLAALSTGLATAVAIVFVVAVLGFVSYALIRPFTHFHYRRSSANGLWDHHSEDSLWKHLD
jgi:hypothetical protein